MKTKDGKYMVTTDEVVLDRTKLDTRNYKDVIHQSEMGPRYRITTSLAMIDQAKKLRDKILDEHNGKAVVEFVFPKREIEKIVNGEVSVVALEGEGEAK